MARVQLHFDAFRAYRQSPGVQAVVNKAAQSLADAANSRAVVGKTHYNVAPAVDVPHGSVALVTTTNDDSVVTYQTKFNEYKYHSLAGAAGV